MYTYKELREASREYSKDETDSGTKLAILGDCSTQLLTMALKGYGVLENSRHKIFEAGFNQIDYQVVDNNSEMYGFDPDFIILWIGTEKLYEDFLDKNIRQREGFADELIDKVERYWGAISENSNAKILQMNFPELNDRVLGNYSAKVNNTFIYQIRKLNWLIEERMSKNSRVYPIDLLSIQIQIGHEKFFDPAFYYNAKINISTKALPYVAMNIYSVIRSIQGKIIKCVVLDLDNTLWGGIIGEDGIDNIEIGDFGCGHIFLNIQRWFKELKEFGVVLAVCSKNDMDTALAPFEKLDEMILKYEDFAIFIANWNDKASNIQKVKEVLNLSYDSILFIDDNKFERNLVRGKLPEVQVPELPEDAAWHLPLLQMYNYFENSSYSDNGLNRTEYYINESKRIEYQLQFDNIDDYLNTLGMEAEVKPFENKSYARIAELSNRSNQFNLRTIRYAETDIKEIAQNDYYVTMSCSLRDKFGKYGLISAVILEKKGNILFINTWFMSCRVLKRGVEKFLLNKIVEVAKGLGAQIIEAEYIPTEKNGLVSKLYLELGFYEIKENYYMLEINNYIDAAVCITEVQR